VAAAAGLGSCEEDFNSGVAEPQSWDAEDAKGIVFAAQAKGVIDLNTVVGEDVAIVSFAAPVVEGGEVRGYEIELDGQTIGLSAEGRAQTAELQALVTSLYGKRPEVRTLKGVVSALIDIGEESYRAVSGELAVSVTPKAPFIDVAYYLIGDVTGWIDNDERTLLKFSHTGDVYENPLFTTVVKVGDGSYWKVIPQVRVDTFLTGKSKDLWGEGVLGCAVDGDEALNGELVPGGGAMKIRDGGWVKITLDMMEYSYKVEALGEVGPYLYVPGSHQGWNPMDAPVIYSEDMVNYSGFVSLNGEFKFTSMPSWDGTNYGAGASEGLLSTDGGAGNLSVAEGFYYINVNTASLAWSATEIKTFGVIGDATPGGWDASTPMEFDAAKSEYKVTITLEDGEFKFRANDSWDINLGGDTDNLRPNGANIAIRKGIYIITLKLSDPSRYECTIRDARLRP
jgi:hypothetical protein